MADDDEPLHLAPRPHRGDHPGGQGCRFRHGGPTSAAAWRGAPSSRPPSPASPATSTPRAAPRRPGSPSTVKSQSKSHSPEPTYTDSPRVAASPSPRILPSNPLTLPFFCNFNRLPPLNPGVSFAASYSPSSLYLPNLAINRRAFCLLPHQPLPG